MITTIVAIIIFSFIIFRWSFFHLKDIPISALIIVFLLKSIAGYISFKYHSIYFAGGDGAIYLQGGKDLLRFSDGNPLVFIKLFFNMNRGLPEWESTYTQIIYWDSKSTFNFINDNRNAIRFNSLINLFSFRNLGVHIVLLNFLSIIGLTALYKSISLWLPKLFPLAVFTAVFLSPSILFWTSGILKETHTIVIIGLYMFYFNRVLSSFTLKKALTFLLFAFLLLLVRSYFAIIIYASSLILLILSHKQLRKGIRPILIITLLMALILYILPTNILDIIIQKQQDFIFIGQKANSFFSIPSVVDAYDVFLYFPESFINVFLQPQLFTFDSWLYLFPVIENIDILFFCFLAIRFTKKPPKEYFPFLASVFIIYFLSSWIIGLTVPVQGAIARYKSLAQPFLLIFIFSFIDWDFLKNKYFSKQLDQ